MNTSTMKFPCGHEVATPNAMATIASPGDIRAALARHYAGDWGDLSQDDRRSNDDALHHGGRLLSSYKASNGTKFWIITEADRSATTVLLPEDY